jgi:ABC-type amino acid transport substrate-binding protein
LRHFLILLTGLVSLFAAAQPPDSLVINYYTRVPFAYQEEGRLKGIDVDIMNEYVLWLVTKKKIAVKLRYSEHQDFQSFLAAVKKGGQTGIGLGSVPVSAEYQKEIDFSAPYLKHVAFCITNGNSPDVKVKGVDDITRTLGSMSALTVSNTALQKYVGELKKQYLTDLKIVFHPDETKILDEIARNVLCFGYVDAVNFWYYLKTHPGKFLKMQKALSQAKEEFAFMFPKNSPHKALFNEFFSSATGFKSAPGYRSTLERHLGAYMASNVAVN